jgi:hypothetical protein
LVHRPFSERPFSERLISERPLPKRPISERPILGTAKMRPFSECDHFSNDHSPNDQSPNPDQQGLETLLNTSVQCCRAKSARSCIILMEPKPQRDAAQAPTAPAPNIKFNTNGLLKMSQSVVVFYFFHSSTRSRIILMEP